MLQPLWNIKILKILQRIVPKGIALENRSPTRALVLNNPGEISIVATWEAMRVRVC